MKRLTDLTAYEGILPYASEIFGVYQPLLGWRGARSVRRIERGFAIDTRNLLGQLAYAQDPVKPPPENVPRRAARGQTVSLRDALARELPALDAYDDAVWDRVLTPERLREILTSQIAPELERRARTGQHSSDVARERMRREATFAGELLQLKESERRDVLKRMFYARQMQVLEHLRALRWKDPLDLIDPHQDLDRVGLSPIGIVHLFRQYFFELDTFLGPPVSHVWMSPGSTVELVEINTRRTVTERTVETEFGTTVKTETSLTEEEELSEAVKEENRSETKFGMNATVNQGWITGSATASSNIDMGTTQASARETTHRRMRQQSEKLSTEIRKNYKSTFKTVTEVTDTSSKRYILANTTDELINYELRRKMRQVGVQVQDVGTYLCWQTYVDDPGRQLGIAKLVHLAKSPEVGTAPPPESIPVPQPLVTQVGITIPFKPATPDTELDDDDAYRDGWEVVTDTADGDTERIKVDFGPYTSVCDQPGYEFDFVAFDMLGADAEVSERNVDVDAGKVTFDIHVDHIHFHNQPSVNVMANVTWKPTQATIDDVNAKNAAKTEEFNAKTRYEFERAYVESARERIKLAGEVEQRPFEDLREEERISVYRMLIQDMLTRDLPMPDDRTRHVVSELLNTIFDVEKMLYFVAPEWWRPRLHRSHQKLTAEPGRGRGERRSVFVGGVEVATELQNLGEGGPEVPEQATVTWGGASGRGDSYYVTEESQPAKLGSSLGWLLQLDGDDMRNAFLNAPWVKAVIPIRPGKERAAINWLQRVGVEGSDGLDARYVAPADQLADIPHTGEHVTLRDAIDHLCDLVRDKHEDSLRVGRFPTGEIDDSNTVASTPVDRVYEHGFYALQGGFRARPGEESFEIFDQWVEVLPTDQVVPVEVAYDPKTGRQVP